jgi:hypothetical protein
MYDNIPNLLKNQRKNIKKIGNYGKMNFHEIKRLDLYCNDDIFGEECVLYTGAIKHEKTAIFSYKGKKVSLYRLLYHNYKGDINKKDSLYMECPNYGKCILISHIHLKK